MAISIDTLLKEHLPVAQFIHHASPSLTEKQWPHDIGRITNHTSHPASWQGVHRFLGPGLDLANYDATYECPSSVPRLNTAVHSLNTKVERIVMEAEVQRDFDRNLGLPLALAFQSAPFLEERSQAGPPSSTTSSKTIDSFFSFGRGSHEIPCIIGDLKKPGTIKPREWNRAETMSSLSNKLGQEIRGYAHLYKCPQVFIYDSLHLLLVQFQARNQDEIKNAQCPVDVWVLPRLTHDVNVCTVRYALYWMACRGLMRIMGQQAADLEWGGWTRTFHQTPSEPTDSYGAMNFTLGSETIQALSADQVDPERTVYRLELQQTWSLFFCRHLPTVFRWAKEQWPSWFLPQVVYLKQRKAGWDTEFELEKRAYDLLRPIQGIHIPYFFGEGIYKGCPALVLSEVLGDRLDKLETKPEEDVDFKAKLSEIFRVFAEHSITYEDARLDNLFLVQGRVMAVDLEKVRFDPIMDWKDSDNCGNVNSLMFDLRFQRDPQNLNPDDYIL
ncbi:Protein kinase-like domain [Apiospora phragmitis]|uniref:Protein kinase-like domain n=1 Tax=Apiospora phragmitis TaxID=2905665 RepID=A0ABR1VGG4_9PEZI